MKEKNKKKKKLKNKMGVVPSLTMAVSALGCFMGELPLSTALPARRANLGERCVWPAPNSLDLADQWGSKAPAWNVERSPRKPPCTEDGKKGFFWGNGCPERN